MEYEIINYIYCSKFNMKKFNILTLCLLFLFIAGCNKSDDNSSNSQGQSLAVITITGPSNITSNSAIIQGSILSDGNGSILSKGVSWSINPNPDISDNKTNEGTGTNEFSSQLTNLEANTTYFARTYVENEIGFSYSDEISFTTVASCSSNIFNGSVILSTQQEVVTFGANNYCELTGQLFVNRTPNDSSDYITDLSPLGSINKVRNLRIDNTQFLENINALENLTEVTHQLYVVDNDNLKNIDGLRNISSQLNNVYIEYNDELVNIDGLTGISSIVFVQNLPSMNIRYNPKLQNINGISNLEIVEDGVISISGNDQITNIDALSSIPSTIKELVVFGNENLENLNGISHLTIIEGSLFIEANAALPDISMSNLTTITGELTIGFNYPGLTSLDGLQNLSSIGGEFRLVNNHSLVNIDALSNLSTVGSLEIENCNAISNLNGLSSLTNIDDYCNMIRNNILTDFCGLELVVNSNGIGGEFLTKLNAYNPTLQDIMNGDCSQ